MSEQTVTRHPDTVEITPELIKVLSAFPINGKIETIRRIKKGYINRTYRIRVTQNDLTSRCYTLQRINTNVFPDVDALMENYRSVTEHLKTRLALPGHRDVGCVQTLTKTVDGNNYYRDESGCWRLLSYFSGVFSTDIPEDPNVFYEAGRAFGQFAYKMSTFPPEKLNVVIPQFHDTYKRYCDLESAIVINAADRVDDVEKEIEFIRRRKANYRVISSALERGEIPLRVCHNDCNLNNILFDKETGLPVAIIDLDTVMPGTLLYDYGDSMRIGTNTAKDDEKDLSKVSCNTLLYEKYARGYLESAGKMFTQRELELLPYAALVITSEDGIRFLADYINGDTYYTTDYAEQNLDRSRTQLTLLADMERKLPQIKAILDDIYKELGLKADLFKEDLWSFGQ